MSAVASRNSLYRQSSMDGFCNGIGCKIAPGGICRSIYLPFFHVLLTHYTRSIPLLYTNQFQELTDSDTAAQCQLGRQSAELRVNPSRPLDNGIANINDYILCIIQTDYYLFLIYFFLPIVLPPSYSSAVTYTPHPSTRNVTTIALSHRYTNTDSHAIRHQRLSTECVSLLGSALLPPVLG